MRYIRYGDDWLCFAKSEADILHIQKEATQFLADNLQLTVHPKLNKISPVYKGVTFLGEDVWPSGLRITSQTQTRIQFKINAKNHASYEALVRHFGNDKAIKNFYWQTMDI
jgi:hypothetical protein